MRGPSSGPSRACQRKRLDAPSGIRSFSKGRPSDVWGSHHEISRVVARPDGPDGAGCVRCARANKEIALLSPNPIEATINKLTADFEAKTGIHVKITYGTGVSTRKTVASGQALDVSLLFAPFPEALKTGNIDPKSATVIGRLRLAIGVRKGAPKPDISTRRRRVLPKREVHRLRGSGTGERRWCGAPDARQARDHAGVEAEDQVGADRRRAGRGGERRCEIAFGPYLSDMRNPGLDVVGALPPEASTPVDITGFLSTSVKDPKAARALLDYLSSPAVAPVYESAKIFPVR